MPTQYKTKYYGIWLQTEDGEWWIVDDLGGEQYCGWERPSEAMIDAYRQELTVSNPRAY